MSERLELSQLAKAEARRHRESLLQLFSGQPSCAIGAFCLADEVLVRSLETDVLYVNLASNNHQEKGRLASSPDPRHQLKGKAQLKDGVACDVAMVRAFPNHHAKYWLAGLSELEAPKGVLFSGDLTPSALDPEATAGNSHELMLVLTDSEAVELRAFVRWLMTCRPATEVLPKRELLLPGSLPKLPNFKILLLTQPNKSLKREVLALIAEARNSIDVTSWAIAADNEVFAQLKAVAGHKRVRVLAHDEPDNRRALLELCQAGAEIRFCPGMHAKVWLADRESNPSAVVSSANLFSDGLDVGFELGVRLVPGDVRLEEVSEFIKSREAHLNPWSPLDVEAVKTAHSLKQHGKPVRVAPRLKLF